MRFAANLLALVLLWGMAASQTTSESKGTGEPQADCTEAARHDKVKGTVTLLAVVDTRGKAHDVKVIKSLRPDLDKRALDAVKKWKFEPAKKDGRPVKIQVKLAVDFDCTQ